MARGPIWTSDELDIMRKMYYNAPLDVLLKSLPNRTYNSIKLCARNKLKIKRHPDTYIYRVGDVSPLLDETLLAYYWNGFLAADAHFSKNNRLNLSINEKDKNHLDKFAAFVFSKSKKTCNNAYTVTLMDKERIAALKTKYQFHNRKSYNPCIIPSEELKAIAFFIGFIDGDGSIKKQYKRNDSIITIKCHSSWGKWLDFYRKFIYTYFDVKDPNRDMKRILFDAQGYAKIAIGNKKAVHSLKNFALQHDLPILTRKWDKISL